VHEAGPIQNSGARPPANSVPRPASLAALTLALLLCAGAGAADHHPMRFGHVTLDDGLSQSNVLAILQDSQGLMWFGTENGLNRYNGYEIETFKRERGNPLALGSDFIYDLAEDADGNLWIATNGGGLAKKAPGESHFTSYRHDPADPDSIGSNVVRTLLVDERGALWLGTRGAGLDRFDPATETFTHHNFHDDGTPTRNANEITEQDPIGGGGPDEGRHAGGSGMKNRSLPQPSAGGRPTIPDKLYFKIGEVSRLTGVEPYVLRYWESEFDEIQPVKFHNQRRYRKKDIELILEIRRLLYEERFTIAGARKQLREGRRGDRRQMELELTDPVARKAVERIRKELETIRKMLD